MSIFLKEFNSNAMKTILLFVAAFFAVFSCHGQQIHSIRFIHFGDELQPIGTVVISVEKKLTPNDRPLDSHFGISIKTSMKTFEIIEKLIKQSKFRINNPVDTDYRDNLEIIDSDGFKLYLFSAKYNAFFADLKAVLKDEEDRNEIFDAFARYY